MIWVVTSNSNHCCIYHSDKNHSQLTLLKEISHPELKLKTGSTLTSDKPGHYQTSESARGAYSPHMDAKEKEIDRFAREIAEELDKGRGKNAYEHLIIIMPAHMSGLLFKHMNQHVKNLVIKHIQKDVEHSSEKELIALMDQ